MVVWMDFAIQKVVGTDSEMLTVFAMDSPIQMVLEKDLETNLVAVMDFVIHSVVVMALGMLTELEMALETR